MPETRLRGKRVLLVAPKNFSYDVAIATALEDRGAIVTLWPDRLFESSAAKAALRYAPWSVENAGERGYRNLVAQIDSPFDEIVCILGESLFPGTLRELRESSPSATFRLYMWDSFKNKPHLRRHLDSFDKVYTFDPVDAKNLGLVHRPLFYLSDVSKKQQCERYLMSMVGTLHSDRSRVANLVASQMANHPVQSYFFLYAPTIFHAVKDRLINPAPRHASVHVSRVGVARGIFLDVLAASRSILDIHHSGQSGLTMRTIEALGANRKLVTTNHSVRECDFYSESRVLVIERQRAKLDMRFFDQPTSEVSPGVRARYSLEGWIDEVFDDHRRCVK